MAIPTYRAYCGGGLYISQRNREAQRGTEASLVCIYVSTFHSAQRSSTTISWLAPFRVVALVGVCKLWHILATHLLEDLVDRLVDQ